MNNRSKSDSVFCGVRLSKDEIEFINSKSKGVPKVSRSDFIRRLIDQEIANQFPEKEETKIKAEMELIKDQILLNQLNIFYIGSLLTALVRKTRKNDPSEAEQMIELAKKDALRKQAGEQESR